MVSDDFFSSLEEKEYSQSTTPNIALDWLLNIKKFCVIEESGANCMRGVYETKYGIEDYASYANPVTNLGNNYKEFKIGEADSDVSTGDAGEVAQTSPRNPHRYTLNEDEDSFGDPPTELTGEYLGAFFHHKGNWYASFDDVDNIGGESISDKEITINTKKVKIDSLGDQIKKRIFVLDKFFPNGENASVADCSCDWLIVEFFGESASGSICSQGFSSRLCWCEGGFYDVGSTRSRIVTAVDAARADGVWTSSVNFAVKAHSDEPCDPFQASGGICTGNNAGTRSGTLSVTYRGVTKSTSIGLVVAEYGTNCSEEDVGKIITVYANKLADESYFEIV